MTNADYDYSQAQLMLVATHLLFLHNTLPAAKDGMLMQIHAQQALCLLNLHKIVSSIRTIVQSS